MERYQLTPEAVGDLVEICDFINQDNPEAADRVEDAILRACDLLASAPLAGRVRKDLTPLPLRFWVVQPYSMYLIVYDTEKKPLQIIRILHGARDLPSVLMYASVGSSNTSPCGPDRFFCTFTLSSEGLARRLLFFSRRRRRFVLGMRRALMDRLLRPLTLCRSLMMSGRRGWPALRMRWSRMRRGSGLGFCRSRARML